MLIDSFAQTDPGHRKENEDFIVADPALNLFIVCDGVGGSAHGKVASEHAAIIIRDSVRQNIPRSSAAVPDEAGSREIETILKTAVEESCSVLSQIAVKEPKYSRMATTATALLIAGTRGYMAHVGDSRLYLLRGEKVHQLSRDHTIVAELMSAGQLTEEQAASHPLAHVLTRSIGVHDSVKVDTLAFELLPGDAFLLCSDGISKSIFPNERLLDLVAQKEPEKAVSGLIEAAKREDGSDNISVIFVRVAVKHVDRTAQRERIALAMMTIDTLSSLSLFQSLSLEQILQLIRITKVQNVDENFAIVEEGKEQHMMFVILEGDVVVTRQGVELARLGPGEHFGEMALLNKAPRQATVTTISPSQFLLVEHEAFQQLVLQDPQLGVSLLWRLASELSLRLGKANQFV